MEYFCARAKIFYLTLLTKEYIVDPDVNCTLSYQTYINA